MLPNFDENGLLPEGIHLSSWDEFVNRFGFNQRRVNLINGLNKAIKILQHYGNPIIYVDGSFVTSKDFPGDFDACWTFDNIDEGMLKKLISDYPVFMDLIPPRRFQKEFFGGELFPVFLNEVHTGKTFLDFFQIDKETGFRKGIIQLKL